MNCYFSGINDFAEIYLDSNDVPLNGEKYSFKGYFFLIIYDY